jgi:hypothetical protein
MFFALFWQTITVVGGYAGVLITALACMAIADCCCAIVFFRGGGLRWIAAAIALPSLFVVWDTFAAQIG